MTTKRMLIMLILTGIVFGAVFGMKWFGTKMMNEYVDNMPTPTATVSAAAAEAMTWPNQLTPIGTLVAVNGADVTAEVGGIVTAIHFESGDAVKRGDRLIDLEADAERAELQQLRAQADLAETNLKRRQRLFQQEAISKSELDTVTAEFDAAKAAAVAQAARLAQKDIRAPFDGRLGVRRVAVGQYLSPGTAIVNLQSLDPIDLDFSLPEQHFGDVEAGFEVAIKVDAWPEETFSGKVLAIEPRVETATRNFLVRARFPNGDERLRPGMFGQVILSLEGSRDVLAVPRTAINYSSYGTSVYVIEPVEDPQEGEAEKKAVQRFVTVGDARGDFVAIVDGLKEGDEVATSGLLKLRNGQPVKIDYDQSPDAELDPNPEQG
ncbi:efflux RND transporter periplasmic adaptor subunit [Polycyclovorans algicola]|uniref:efflux RND transporter periplasmic adaptor subunit n=1 Tax=Polycyclovorans algicola TaxID=616992 RepID=UPI0004A6AE4E|nr:efflux RND transporter periplasmic adaptor subunit [Polycyclovorans algicola]